MNNQRIAHAIEPEASMPHVERLAAGATEGETP